MRRITFNAATAQFGQFAIVVIAALLSACSSVPLTPDATSTTAQAGRPALPPAGSGRGGYYQDDGPADVIPEGLADTPDAVPRIETPYPRNSRPYVVFGKTYTPITHDRPFRQRGIASWYGKKFHGQKTASGELYDMFKMTAAHPTLPIPSYARVTHLANGKQVIVRINDRGPFHSNRVIDLSYTAALKLGYLERGSGEVEVERLLPDEIVRINNRLQQEQAGATEVAAVPAAQVEVAEVPAPAAMTVSMPPAQSTSAASAPATASAGTGQPPRLAGQPGAWYLQLGAFSQRANADAARAVLANSGALPGSKLDVVEENGLFRLFGGPYANRFDADAAAAAVRAANRNVIVVQR